MAYTSKKGRRPAEFASKSAHAYVIRDPEVQAFLAQCILPKSAGDVDFSDHRCLPYQPVANNPIHHIVAVDGGYTEVAVQTEFPSATVCFFQIGALVFAVEDLEQLDRQAFIDPDDMARLKQIHRMKFTMPVRNVALRTATTLTGSVRRAIYDFFRQRMEDGVLIETLRWFLYEEYDTPLSVWTLSSCPMCQKPQIPLLREQMRNFTFACPHCGGEIS